MKTMGGDYRVTVWKRRSDRVEKCSVEDSSALVLQPDEWDVHRARVAKQLHATGDSIPIGRLSGVEETSDAFRVIAVLAAKDGEMTTATVEWPKRPFDAWWNAEKDRLDSTIAPLEGTFRLPTVPMTACSNDTWTPMFSEEPLPRQLHTAVWTGSEMILWGGRAFDGTVLNTGLRYNPVLDSWATTPMGSAVPDARYRHTAVWTGMEMIVWGGAGTQLFGSGGKYNPSTGVWAATSTASAAPSARYAHTAVWTGTAMIVWGGAESASHSVNSGGRYDPVGAS